MTDSKEVGPIPRWLRRVTASDGGHLSKLKWRRGGGWLEHIEMASTIMESIRAQSVWKGFGD
jgi:hypothetical protein